MWYQLRRAYHENQLQERKYYHKHHQQKKKKPHYTRLTALVKNRHLEK